MREALQQVNQEFRRLVFWVIGVVVLLCGAALGFCLRQECAFSDLAAAFVKTCAGLFVAGILFALAFAVQKVSWKILAEPFKEQRVRPLALFGTGSLLLGVLGFDFGLLSMQHLCLHVDWVVGNVQSRPLFEPSFYLLTNVPGVLLAFMAGPAGVFKYRAGL